MDRNRARHCSSNNSASNVKDVVTQQSGRPKASSPLHKASSRARVCSAVDDRPLFIGELPDRQEISKGLESGTRAHSRLLHRAVRAKCSLNAAPPYPVRRAQTMDAFRSAAYHAERARDD